MSIVVVAILFLIVGWFAHQYFGETVGHIVTEIQAQHEPKTANEEKDLEKAPEGVFCAQVITPARNPDTGDIKEFPTPCSVPEGWEVIQNDIPGL